MQRDPLLPARADSNSGDSAADQLLDPPYIGLGSGRQLTETAAAGEVLIPPRQILVYRLGMMDVGLRQRHHVMADPADLIP